MKPINVILVGAGGYGEFYLEALFSGMEARGLRLVGVVDPHPERCRHLAELTARRIPLYSGLKHFYRTERCDLAILASPIHFHADQTCLALERGSHVLCEKPLCVKLEDISRMRMAEEASGKTVTVGYQWSFSIAIQRLKADILAGRLGRPLRLRTLAMSPRGEDYYQRNQWAGRRRTLAGELILDSPVNNAHAHFLHNMLYVLGRTIPESAQPQKVEAELWRANAIENYDTAALRVRVEGGPELLLYTTHAVAGEKQVRFCYEFERATVHYGLDDGRIIAHHAGGEIIDYGSPEADPYQKIEEAAESVRTGKRPLCGIAAAEAHVQCVLQAQAAPLGVQDFSPETVRIDQSGPAPLRHVEGLEEKLERCYASGKLFHEERQVMSLSLP